MRDIVDFLSELHGREAVAFKKRIDDGLRCPMCGRRHDDEDFTNDGAGFDHTFAMQCMCGQVLQVKREVHVEFQVVCEAGFKVQARDLRVGDQVLRGREWRLVEKVERHAGVTHATLGLSTFSWHDGRLLTVKAPESGR